MTLSDRQAAASRQGYTYEGLVEVALKGRGWEILETRWRHPEADIEIDIVARDSAGETWWIECKGSWESPGRNGLERTDTVKKAISNGAILRLTEGHMSYMIITSHLPQSGSAGERWLGMALGPYVDAVERFKSEMEPWSGPK